MKTSVVALVLAAALAACSPPSEPTDAPTLAPTPTSIETTTPQAGCMHQEDWEPNEGIYSMHAFAAKRALNPLDPATGVAESATAAKALRAMADLAAGPDPQVAGLLRAGATLLDSAAAAFRAGDAAMAGKWLAEADARHQEALGSTTARDWCP